jgi:hypothetical protein
MSPALRGETDTDITIVSGRLLLRDLAGTRPTAALAEGYSARNRYCRLFYREMLRSAVGVSYRIDRQHVAVALVELGALS